MEQHSLVRIESLSPAVGCTSLVLMFTLCSRASERWERRKKCEAQSPGAYANLGDAAPLDASIFIDSCFIYIYFPAQDFPPYRLAKSTDKSTAAHAGSCCCCLYMKWVHVRIYSLLKLLFSPACTVGIFISVRAPLRIKVNNKHEGKYTVSSRRRQETVYIWIQNCKIYQYQSSSIFCDNQISHKWNNDFSLFYILNWKSGCIVIFVVPKVTQTLISRQYGPDAGWMLKIPHLTWHAPRLFSTQAEVLMARLFD